MGRFTKISQEAFDELQVDAGVVLTYFDPLNPSEPDDSAIITATTGGISASCVPSFEDWGEDVDNCPANMKELKHPTGWDAKLAFTALGTSPEMIRMGLGMADINSSTGKVTPRATLSQADFRDVWWVGDRVDDGLVAVRLINALSTSGFALKTDKGKKGQVSVELTGHYSLAQQNVVPMEFWSMEGTGLKSISVASYASSTAGKTDVSAAYTPASGESLVYKLGSAPVAVAYDDTLSSGWTAWNGSDDITATTGQYITVAAVVTSTGKARATGHCMVTAAPAA